ncbi:uncharacterized protein J3R85_009123 [Psidium guajava]|nr:uncharacterized protein J3R85_009123 [Psidium guajava]
MSTVAPSDSAVGGGGVSLVTKLRGRLAIPTTAPPHELEPGPKCGRSADCWVAANLTERAKRIDIRFTGGDKVISPRGKPWWVAVGSESKVSYVVTQARANGNYTIPTCGLSYVSRVYMIVLVLLRTHPAVDDKNGHSPHIHLVLADAIMRTKTRLFFRRFSTFD